MFRSFDYKCLDCGHIDDYIVGGSTLNEILEKQVECVKCYSKNTERLVSAPGGVTTGFQNAPKTFVKKDFKHE